MNGGSPLDEARAEERGVLNRGKRQRDQERERERQQPQTANHRRGAQAQRAELGGPERPETGDDRDGDVGQHHHLEQLDEPVGRPLQRRRLLAEEQPGEDAESEPGEDLSGKRHGFRDRKSKKATGSARAGARKTLPNCRNASRRSPHMVTVTTGRRGSGTHVASRFSRTYDRRRSGVRTRQWSRHGSCGSGK